MNTKQIIANLQSRINRRSRDITASEMWISGYRVLGRMKDVREEKKHLARLVKDQIADKRAKTTIHKLDAECNRWAKESLKGKEVNNTRGALVELPEGFKSKMREILNAK